MKQLIHLYLLVQSGPDTKNKKILYFYKPSDISSGGFFFVFATQRTIVETLIQAKYLTYTSEENLSASEQLNFL